MKVKTTTTTEKPCKECKHYFLLNLSNYTHGKTVYEVCRRPRKSFHNPLLIRFERTGSRLEALFYDKCGETGEYWER